MNNCIFIPVNFLRRLTQFCIYLLFLTLLTLSGPVIADEDDMLKKVEESAKKIKDLIDKYNKAEINIVKREIVSITDTNGKPQDCDVAIFYDNGQQARLRTENGKFEGNFDHKHNKNVPKKALSLRLSGCACKPFKTKHQVTWLGINEELEKIKKVLVEELEEAGEEKVKEYAEKAFNKLAEKVGSGFAAGASSFLSGFKVGADLGAPIGDYLTENINKILDAAVNRNIKAAELNDNAPLYPNVGHAELRGRVGNWRGASPQLQNKWDITVRCGNKTIPPSSALWADVGGLVEKEYQLSPAGQQEIADAAAQRQEAAKKAAEKREQARLDREERQAEAKRKREERALEAERKREEAEQKRKYEEKMQKLRDKAGEIARTCTICDPIRDRIKATKGQIENTENTLPGLEKAVQDAEEKAARAKKKEKQAQEKLDNFRNPDSWVTDVKTGRTITSTDLEVRRQASIEAMERYSAGEATAEETTQDWSKLNDPDVINDLKQKAEKRLEAELNAAKQKTEQANKDISSAKRELGRAKRKLKNLQEQLKELLAKLDECIKQCKDQSMNIARGRVTDLEDLMGYTVPQPASVQLNTAVSSTNQVLVTPKKEVPSICPSPAANQPIQVGANSEVGSGAELSKKVSGMIGGALGGLLGGSGIGFGGSAIDEDDVSDDPEITDDPVPDTVKKQFIHSETGNELEIGGVFNEKGLLVSSTILKADGDGTFQTVFLENPSGNRGGPIGYWIYEIYSEWSLTVSWTKDRYVDGQLVEHSEGGWTESGSTLLDTFSVPVYDDAIWNQLGFSNAAKGVRSLGTQFLITREQLKTQPVYLVVHITQPSNDPVTTVPFVIALSLSENDELMMQQVSGTKADDDCVGKKRVKINKPAPQNDASGEENTDL